LNVAISATQPEEVAEMSASVLARLVPHSDRAHRTSELERRLDAALQQLEAVEALRRRQAEAADFYCALDDHVRAAVLLHCSAEIREALSTSPLSAAQLSA
jgi:hypothetical protein